MNPLAENARPKRRTAPKQERQTQLIKATIRSIAKHGLSVTTMATVSREAGLSQGIINLHFKSKQKLLEETLLYVVDEYRAAWDKAIRNSGESAAERLRALVAVDFDRNICQRNKLAVWFAFWGESRSRPTYRKICARRDREYRQVLTRLCQDIIVDGGYSSHAESVAYGLSAMSEGLWLDLLLSPVELDPQRACEISMSYLHDVFPDHFEASG